MFAHAHPSVVSGSCRFALGGLRGDCLAGGYTASVIIYNRPHTSTYHISPGDLDEGIKALLVFRGEGDTERQGAGFERVRAFSEGVMNGAESCLDYQA